MYLFITDITDISTVSKIDDLETKKVLGQVNEDEFRKFKSSYAGVLAKVKQRLSEIEKQVREMGLNEEDLKVKDKFTKEHLDEMLLNDEITMEEYEKRLKEIE